MFIFDVLCGVAPHCSTHTLWTVLTKFFFILAASCCSKISHLVVRKKCFVRLGGGSYSPHHSRLCAYACTGVLEHQASAVHYAAVEMDHGRIFEYSSCDDMQHSLHVEYQLCTEVSWQHWHCSISLGRWWRRRRASCILCIWCKHVSIAIWLSGN